MNKKIKFLSTIGLAFLILLTVSFVFFANKKSSFAQKASGESLIKAAFDKFGTFSDDLYLIAEVVQTRYEASSPSVSLQGNLSAFDDGKIELNDRSFAVQRGKLYWSTDTEEGSTEEALAYFGKENTFTSEGVDIIRDFYIPSPLKLGFENGSNLTFSRDEGIKLRWNADERNEYPLVVVLQYIPEESDVLVTKQFEFNDREQSAHISPDDLSEFPSERNLILYAGRGNGKNVTVRDKGTSLAGLAITSVPGIVIK